MNCCPTCGRKLPQLKVEGSKELAVDLAKANHAGRPRLQRAEIFARFSATVSVRSARIRTEANI